MNQPAILDLMRQSTDLLPSLRLLDLGIDLAMDAGMSIADGKITVEEKERLQVKVRVVMDKVIDLIASVPTSD